MRNGSMRTMRARRSGAVPSPNRWTSNAARLEPTRSQHAQKTYEQYLALARAEAQIGNTVGAENYYQHAEHYFRLMSSDRRGT
jgi:Domain of unknown function (DUF4167)